MVCALNETGSLSLDAELMLQLYQQVDFAKVATIKHQRLQQQYEIAGVRLQDLHQLANTQSLTLDHLQIAFGIQLDSNQLAELII